MAMACIVMACILMAYIVAAYIGVITQVIGIIGGYGISFPPVAEKLSELFENFNLGLSVVAPDCWNYPFQFRGGSRKEGAFDLGQYWATMLLPPGRVAVECSMECSMECSTLTFVLLLPPGVALLCGILYLLHTRGNKARAHNTQTYIVMAFVVMVFIDMAYLVMAYR